MIEHHGTFKHYPRYGGTAQTYPLTDDQTRYDNTCEEIDKLTRSVSEMRVGRFRASEFMWFNAFVLKLHVFPKQEQLDRQLESLKYLFETLQARGAEPPHVTGPLPEQPK